MRTIKQIFGYAVLAAVAQTSLWGAAVNGIDKLSPDLRESMTLSHEQRVIVPLDLRRADSKGHIAVGPGTLDEFLKRHRARLHRALWRIANNEDALDAGAFVGKRHACVDEVDLRVAAQGDEESRLAVRQDITQFIERELWREPEPQRAHLRRGHEGDQEFRARHAHHRNSIAAISAGADQVHGSALGMGERVGNTPLDQLLVNLKLMGWIENDPVGPFGSIWLDPECGTRRKWAVKAATGSAPRQKIRSSARRRSSGGIDG